jgi:acetylornithine deacetylase/succinyl-diaminopimelate desuccinylase family protein
MTDLAKTISDLVDKRFDEEVAYLAKLVQTPSDNPPGDLAEAAEINAKLLEGLGFTVERHRVPDAVTKAIGMISAVNLVARRVYGAGGPTIALNAHGDVVPPGEGWTADPYGAEIRDGWMYGRGAAVSKSDFASYAFAILALEAAGVPLKGSLELHGTYDEEVGGDIGPKWLLDEGISKPDLALAAGFSYNVVTAHNGVLHLEIVVEGKSAHAAIPYTGIDALEAANGVLTALYAFRRSLSTKVSATPGIGSPQLTMGLIKGGINTNVVPDKVSIRLDRRMIPEESPAEVEADLRRVVEGAMQAFPDAKATVERILLATPLVPLPGSEKFAEVLTRHGTAVFGEKIGITGVPLYTDARHYAAAGVPIVLYGAGPRTITEANAHRADERLPLEDLRKATKVVALALAEMLAP